MFKLLSSPLCQGVVKDGEAAGQIRLLSGGWHAERARRYFLVLYKLPLFLTVIFENATNTEGGFVSVFGFETKLIV